MSLLQALLEEDNQVFEERLAVATEEEIEVVDEENRSLVYLAVVNSLKDKLQLLLNSHPLLVDISNSNLETPLMAAARMADVGLLRALLLAECNVDAKDMQEHTAFYIAVVEGARNVHVELGAVLDCMDCLVEHNCTVDTVDLDMHSALHSLCVHSFTAKAIGVLKALFDIAKVDPMQRTELGFTPLHLILHHSDGFSEEMDLVVSACEVLLQNGADPNAVCGDKLNTSPLHLLLRGDPFSKLNHNVKDIPYPLLTSGRVDLVRLLVEYGARIDTEALSDVFRVQTVDLVAAKNKWKAKKAPVEMVSFSKEAKLLYHLPQATAKGEESWVDDESVSK